MAHSIRIARQRMQVVSRPGPQARWIYHYSLDGAPFIEYGTSLGSLRDRLKVKHPDATVVELWKQRSVA